jgi:N-acylneuraminate cytidylyltransferase
MESHVIAIVPIKQHSERVPRKNFRDFNKKPLYHWILETLQDTPEVDEIIINTDADQVIEEATDKFDVMISERPDELQGDFVSMNKIIRYEVERNEADIFIQTHCTNPLLQSATISEALNEFVASDDADSLFTVTKHQKMLYDKDLEPINHDPYDLSRTQDLPPVYEGNSNLFIFTEETIENTGCRTGEEPMVYEMDEIESIDIDTESDFQLAEYFHAEQ